MFDKYIEPINISNNEGPNRGVRGLTKIRCYFLANMSATLFLFLPSKLRLLCFVPRRSKFELRLQCYIVIEWQM